MECDTLTPKDIRLSIIQETTILSLHNLCLESSLFMAMDCTYIKPKAFPLLSLLDFVLDIAAVGTSYKVYNIKQFRPGL